MIGGFQADSIPRLDLHVCFPGPPAKANERGCALVCSTEEYDGVALNGWETFLSECEINSTERRTLKTA